MPSIGPTELLLILGAVLLLFGGRKLPELARGLGQGIKEFKTATREGVDDDDDEDVEPAPKARAKKRQASEEIEDEDENE